MAYNTGEFRIRRMLRQHGLPPASPLIPDLPVGRTTRRHLTKLLAIACVVREPQRFDVHLPSLDPAQRLQVVELPVRMSLQQVAQLSALPLARVAALNAGYRAGYLPTTGPWRVLLPAAHATQLLAVAARRPHARSGVDCAFRPPTVADLDRHPEDAWDSCTASAP
jgi:membrane-bound lytic murein transglycosylase D